MGVVFIWFGALKVAGTTPVADLVAGTVPWLDRTWFVPALGAAEILMGIAVLIGWHHDSCLRGHHCASVRHVPRSGDTEPGLAFQDGNPLLLTTIGEFVVKNVVLISAALVLASSSGPRRSASAGGSA